MKKFGNDRLAYHYLGILLLVVLLGIITVLLKGCSTSPATRAARLSAEDYEPGDPTLGRTRRIFPTSTCQVTGPPNAPQSLWNGTRRAGPRSHAVPDRKGPVSRNAWQPAALAQEPSRIDRMNRSRREGIGSLGWLRRRRALGASRQAASYAEVFLDLFMRDGLTRVGLCQPLFDLVEEIQMLHGILKGHICRKSFNSLHDFLLCCYVGHTSLFSSPSNLLKATSSARTQPTAEFERVSNTIPRGPYPTTPTQPSAPPTSPRAPANT